MWLGACVESATDDAQQRERLQAKVAEVMGDMRRGLLCTIEDVQWWVVAEGGSLMPYG